MNFVKRCGHILRRAWPLVILAAWGLAAGMWLSRRSRRSAGIDREGSLSEPGPEDCFAQVGRWRFHYTEYPAPGKDIVLIHGFASSTYTWEKVGPLLNRLGYHVWALDLKGFGWSDKPGDTSYDVVTLTEEVNQWMDAVGLREVVLVGNSLGGGIAILLALLHPDKVGRMVLIDAAAYDTEYPLIMKLARLPLSALMTRLFFCRFVVRLTLREVYHHRAWITKDQVEAYHARLRTDNALNAQIAVVRALEFKRVEKYVKHIPEIQSKALIIWGDHDRWIPLSSAYRFRAELPHSEVVIIPECGHMPQEERPDVTARLIHDFTQDRPVSYDKEHSQVGAHPS